MCGIVGFVGDKQAAPILLDGLSKLEYRGYDSAGIAVRNGTDEVEVVKAKGRLKVLEEKTDGGKAVKGTCGIGHKREQKFADRVCTSSIHSIVQIYNPVSTEKTKDDIHQVNSCLQQNP